jgi:hypothetical protein
MSIKEFWLQQWVLHSKHAGFSYLNTYHVDDKGFSFEVLEYFAK